MKANKCVLLIIALAASSCSTMSLRNFEKDKYSDVARGQIFMTVLGKLDAGQTANKELSSQMASVVRQDQQLEKLTAKECGYTIPARTELFVASALIPLIAAGGQLLFNLFVNAELRRLDAIKKAAKPDPSTVRLPLLGNAYRSAECIVFVRMTPPEDKEKPDTVGLVIVLKIVKQPVGKPSRDAYTLVPIYAKAANSIAVAGKPAATGELAKIDVALAVSVKQVSRTQVGDPTIHLQAEAVVKIGSLELGPNSKPRCDLSNGPPCDGSDLLVLPPTDSVLGISVSVAEIGKVGFDIDAADAELRAIQAALGPAIGKAIEAHFK